MDIRFLCPFCGQKLSVEDAAAGHTIACPVCHRPVVVPQSEVFVPPLPPEPEVHVPVAQTPGPTPPNANGKYKCPVCWERFDAGDILHIAVHDSLRGGNGMDQDMRNRFLATQFNDLGQAIDPGGLPTADIACPHCLRQLPQQFLHIPHHIISIVGDQSAGKSYYLSALSKILPRILSHDFRINFHDSDPTGNAPLNEMRKVLFGATTPDQAKLAKTVFEGGMYERLRRQGRSVALPKPFIFIMASKETPDERCGIIFYDNAGEHFQPGINVLEQPGAQHVASASGILFLFDPFNSPEFRRQIKDTQDPQIEKKVVDQQDIILAEMLARIHPTRNLRPGEKISTPLAFVVGKCDVWQHLLGPEPLLEPARDGKIDLDAIETNSERVRELLDQFCPAVVSNAEAISRNVMFFAASSFGHTPVKIGPGEYVPDPSRLAPKAIDIPMLWLFSQIPDNPVNAHVNKAKPSGK